MTWEPSSISSSWGVRRPKMNPGGDRIGIMLDEVSPIMDFVIDVIHTCAIPYGLVNISGCEMRLLLTRECHCNTVTMFTWKKPSSLQAKQISSMTRGLREGLWNEDTSIMGRVVVWFKWRVWFGRSVGGRTKRSGT